MTTGSIGPAAWAAPSAHRGSTANQFDPYLLYQSLIEEHGHPTLCSISNISPNGQGGLAIVRIYSFTQNTKCDPRSTARQGVLYLVQLETDTAARNFLRLAAATLAFSEGWQGGRVAIMLGQGVSILRGIATEEALSGQARLVFKRTGFG